MKRLIFSRLSIRQRLTLLICLLILSVILVFGWISYIGVKKTALKVGQDRLKTLSDQLSTMLAGNARNIISSTYVIANKPAIKKFLASNGKDSAAEALKLLEALRTDTLNEKVELRNSAKVQTLNSIKSGVHININIDSLLFMASQAKPDSGRVGKLYKIDTSIYYPIMATVIDDKKLIGYVIRWKRMESNPKAVEQLSQLLGTDAKLYIGNADGTLWTDMIKPIPAPPINNWKQNSVIEYSRSKSNSVLASIQAIKNSKWLVAIELSKKKILETTDRFLFWILIAGVLLLVNGILATWIMTASISRPLKKLTSAASAIAAGNYSSPPLQISRHDELGKLARAFIAMTTQVQNSQKELEKRADNYKLLFECNPMPMWIISKPTQNIIDVNEAAVNHYGYSRDEFLKLNARDLRPQEDVEKYLSSLENETPGIKRRGIWRHKKKEGTVIMVEVIADDIRYRDQEAKLIVADDVTEKLKAEAELVRHRIMQQELITENTIQVQEKEREELGKELHDNINQILASTKLYLELARSGDETLLSEAISKSYENVNLVIGEIRQLSKQLVPPALDNTLVEAVRELIEEIQAITPINISLMSSNFDEKLLNGNIKLMLYRIVQEQINNILKYAAPSEVAIKIETNPGKLYLKITDNGVGFDTSKKSKGIGLRNIDNRVKFYHGTANIISQPGKGCNLEISIPLQKQVG